jgi:hypothetical protein
VLACGVFHLANRGKVLGVDAVGFRHLGAGAVDAFGSTPW